MTCSLRRVKCRISRTPLIRHASSTARSATARDVGSGAELKTRPMVQIANPARVAPYSARALEGSAIDSCDCAVAVCGGAGAGGGLAAPVCTGRTPGSLRKATHCSFVP